MIIHATKLLPPFTGEGEKWEAWFAQFEEVADDNNWTTSQRLKALRPLMRKSAGEFVFYTLTPEVHSNYRTLAKELMTCYRKVESKKGYQSKWTSLRQTAGQNEEELAAEIKRIYEKAFPGRDTESKQDDLLTKFLQALSDNAVRLAMEYVKDPDDIDEAVEFVVQYKEARKVGKLYNDGSKY